MRFNSITTVFEKNISLNELADIAELSTTYFGKVFKSQTGLAPMDYVNSIKIKKAESYLSYIDTIDNLPSRRLIFSFFSA